MFSRVLKTAAGRGGLSDPGLLQKAKFAPVMGDVWG